jgi:hypothetical protein
VRYFAILQTIITGSLLGVVGSVAPAAASPCAGFFSIGAAVCGDASVQGGVGITPLTETASPLLNQISGSGVAVGAVGTGTGIFGSTAAYGSFGSAHIVTSATSSYTDPNGFLSSVASIGVIGFVDGFTVGASALNVRLVSSLTGNFSGNATGTVNFSLEDLSTNQFVFADQGLFAYRLSSSSSKTTNVTLAAGNTYLFNWSMEADASAGNDIFGTWGPSTSDLAHTGTLNIDVLTPNASLSFLSGANYSSITDAVPESSTWVMMILGFVSICFMTYRRNSKPVLITA